MADHRCRQCDRTYTAARSTSIFCSDRCRKRHWRTERAQLFALLLEREGARRSAARALPHAAHPAA